MKTVRQLTDWPIAPTKTETNPLDAFFEKLAETPRDWKLIDGRYIRSNNRCPIDAAGSSWVKTDGGLGLTSEDCTDIVGSADRIGGWSLRARLLEACGLKEND